MFEGFGASKVAAFSYMADDEHGDIVSFSKFHELLGAGPDLGDTALQAG